MADKAPKFKPKIWKPKSTKIEKGVDVLPDQELQTDLTAMTPVPTVPAIPSIFKKPAAVTQKARPVVAPPSVPKPILRTNTTRRATVPKPVTAIKLPAVPPIAAPVPAPEPVATEAPATEEPVVAQEPVTTKEADTLLPSLPAYEELLKDLSPELQTLQRSIQETMDTTPYEHPELKVYVPEDRRIFGRFIGEEFNVFTLPPLSKKINPTACDELKLQTYKYQAFVRDYIRQASPYRGVLVYHGLGSGKTCTSIAAAEALYSQDNKKIIVMTPIALKENFINELMFCGFRHYRLKNYWTSFLVTDEATKLFAEQVVGVSSAYMKKLMQQSPRKRAIWMPDFSKSESESNFEAMTGWRKQQIREQLYDVIQNKITFIGYTGFSHAKLIEIARNNPTFFDNAVVIIDEVHNLTRLMAGKLDKYLIPSKQAQTAATKGDMAQFQRKARSYEPVGVDTWVPKLVGEQKYDRAFLFYRLLTQAKNSKIIALSGTPIVNQPVEIGIMANLLHGYFHCVEDTVTTTDDRKIAQLQTILKNHQRVNFYSIQKSTGVSTVFFTILQTGYIKLFREGSNELEGTMYVGPEEATPATIQELYAELKTEFQTAGVALTGKPIYKALPLLPPTQEEFNNEFIDTLNLKVKDRITFVKRMSGLISYYRGSKEELMPKVVNDTIVECKLSSVALPQYEKARLKEIETEKNKRSSKQSAFGEAMELVQSESSSYRFRSRALCNFAFPTDIERPFPTKQSDLDDAVGDGRPLLGDTPIDIGDDAVSVVEAEAAEKATTAEDKEGEDEEAPLFEEEGVVVKRILPYKERLEQALAALNARKDTIFRTDPSAPASDQLATYSSKFAAIYERIMASPGSSLVYSNFKTVEGIGVLAMALDANGFAPIKLTGPENDLEFSEETFASFAENPDQPRYILYSGDASIRERQTLINLFNYKRASGKLPQKMRDVLESSYLAGTGNLLGEICKVFMITGAGAEGLSLRNVRTVHIMEPYWNKVRTDQVKGRAVRICSHSDLPYSENPSENQRTVEVFTYVAVFDPAVPPNQTIIVQDDSKTSDQYILGLADAKEAVSSDILKLLKDGAVDCQINKFENEEGIQCFDFDTQGATIGDFLYDPRLREDKAMTEQQFRVQAATVKEEAQMGETVKYKGALYQLLTEKASGRILIYDIKDIKFKAPIGEVLVDPVTLKKKSIRWFTEAT